MGSHARPVLDRLDRFVASRHQAGMSIGDDDAEMRADEMLLAAVITARQKITGDRWRTSQVDASSSRN